MPALALHPQFILSGGAQDVLAAVAAGDDVSVFRVVKHMGEVGSVDVAMPTSVPSIRGVCQPYLSQNRVLPGGPTGSYNPALHPRG